MTSQTFENLFLRLENRSVAGHFSILLLIALGLFLGLSQQSGDWHISHPIDKVFHFGCFALTTLMLGSYLGNFTVAMILGIVVGAGLEVGQIFTASRGFSYFDMLMNISGVAFIWGLSMMPVFWSMIFHRKIRI